MIGGISVSTRGPAAGDAISKGFVVTGSDGAGLGACSSGHRPAGSTMREATGVSYSGASAAERGAAWWNMRVMGKADIAGMLI